MTDLRNTIMPKSDQLNADDLIGTTRTITITKVSANPESAEQPISISFEGDGGKPYRPCKSMRRVMVNVWGPDGNSYVGHGMTLYRDDKVVFGGVAVGGIRISHMSHIPKDVTMALTATRANRKPFTVKPLIGSPRETSAIGDDIPAHATGDALGMEQVPKKRTVANFLADLGRDLAGADTAGVDAVIARTDVQKALDTLTGDAREQLNAIIRTAIARTHDDGGAAHEPEPATDPLVEVVGF